jgi:hypothetical protein
MGQRPGIASIRTLAGALAVLAVVAAAGLLAWLQVDQPAGPRGGGEVRYQPRRTVDTSGLFLVATNLDPWPPRGTLQEIADHWQRGGPHFLDLLDRQVAHGLVPEYLANFHRASGYSFEGKPREAYQALQRARAAVEPDKTLAAEWLYTLIYFQGVVGLRLGEDENCILCRGESSCILPIVPAAVHTNPEGSRLAIRHFTEYLEQFPDDLGVRWLLNVSHMTLGEHPQKVDPRFLVSLDRYLTSEFEVGKFRDVGHLVGVNRLNQGGGAILDDFDNDGLLDLVISSFDPTQPMGYYRNKGDGTFEDRTTASGLAGQLGGLYCVQADYNNDGHLDVFVCRGAWIEHPMRPSLLRNNGDGTFTDVTEQAGLLDPINTISATWADYDNDGWLDLFICCDRQPNRLYHNRGDGTFEEVAAKAGVAGPGKASKGAAWIDYENDGYPDLFVNNFRGSARLYHNNRDGTFTDVTLAAGIDGPVMGFSCWAWDFDNDGWLDLFATSYDFTLDDIVKGLLGQKHARHSNRLFRNLGGKGFQDVTAEAGLDMVFSAMGSNFGDFDNDGYLDFYLGTGAPDLAILVPNRLFKNVAGKRFAEVTGPSGTGHLQKGHGVAWGDWRRDGNLDLFVEMGGAVNGDKYHNILFQNPRNHGNHQLTVKLVGKKTNRAAIGARIKAVTAGDPPLTVHRHVSSGSSFGANPLEQTLGLGKATRVARLEIYWPTSQFTQIFYDIAADQAIEVTEFAETYRKLDHKPIPAPK